jgi:hypothetical protein
MPHELAPSMLALGTGERPVQASLPAVGHNRATRCITEG